MSSPDVNIGKQKHRHRTMIRGLWIGVGIALVVTAGVIVSGIDPAALFVEPTGPKAG